MPSRFGTTLLPALATFLISIAAAVSARTVLRPNVVPLTVRTPHGGFNRMVVSVTVCEPRTDRCATIDDVMVDTGSTGLRLESSAVPPSLRLPAFVDPGGKPLAECLRFVHDDAWGPLVRADLHLGAMTAADLPIQIIADDGRLQPEACPTSTAKPTSNGTLGIGPHLLDCQGSCEQDPASPGVFIDEGGSWSPVRGPVPPANRLPNPVARFGDHANGEVFELPASPAGGADQITGTLTFGVGTAVNNQLGDAKIVRLDGRGHFTTLLGGATFPDSYIDSGTETYLLDDASLPRCAGMTWAYCAVPERTMAATIVGADGAKLPMPFKVGDYRGALDRRVGAWDGFAEAPEPGSKAFVWGAPAFLGRRVSVVQEGKAVPGNEGVVGPLYGINTPARSDDVATPR